MILGQSFPHIHKFLARYAQSEAPGSSCAACAHAAWCDQPPDAVCDERLLRLSEAEQDRLCARAARQHNAKRFDADAACEAAVRDMGGK